MKDKTPLPAAVAAVNMETDDLDLKSLRESKGIALRDIFSATRITTVNLEAIEEGRYHVLPEPVYTRTFIREYARFLGIESGPLLRKYENYLNSLHTSTAQMPRRQRERELPPTGERKKLIISAVLIILLILLITVLFLLESSDRRDLTSSRPASPPPADTGKVAIPPPVPTAAPAVPTSAQATPGQAAPGQLPATTAPSFNLQIVATERTWVRLTADRERPEQLIMEKGDKMERKARESFLLVVGNAGGVQVWFQGQPLTPLGRRGEVKHLKLP